MSIRRSRTIFRIQDQHHTPDIALTRPVQITPDAAREAIRAHRDEHGHLHVPSDAWVEVTGCLFPLGYWLHRQRQTRKGRRLLTIIGADADEVDQFFIDGLHHLKRHLRSKHSVPKGVPRTSATLPDADPSDGFPLAFWYRQITSGEMPATAEREEWAADILGTSAPAWASHTLGLKGRIAA